jgi:NADH-quinone oxidoreductase subunit N
MAACTKIAAFGAMLRLFYVAFGAERWNWQPMLWIIAIITMLVGSILAVVQTDMKRMLAYSSVSHTGFILTGLLGVQAVSALGRDEITSLQAVLFYLTAYGPATVGTFAIVTLVRDAGGEATAFSKWAGLGRRSPVVAGAFGFLLLSMAGIPLTGGFVGKWAVFTVALSAGAWPVVAVAILASVISVFFYVRVIMLMFFNETEGASASVTIPSPLTSVTIAVCVVLTLLLGVVPGPVLDLAGNAGSFIR